MKISLRALLPVLVLIPAASGQFSPPDFLAGGFGTVGQRAGADVNLRFFGGATGIYDTGLVPATVDADGKLLKPDPLFGVETTWGIYGKHPFRRSSLGLDYSGNYRRYTNIADYNGANQQLAAEYGIQASRRLFLNFRGDAGTQTFGTVFGPAFPGSDAPVDSGSMLLDNRMTFWQGSANATYLITQRTSASFGGGGYAIRRELPALPDVNGVTAHGSIQHQLSPRTVVSVQYSFAHFKFLGTTGETNNNTYLANVSHKLTPTLSISGGGGAFLTLNVGTMNIPLPPELAEILGVPFIPVPFRRNSTLPMYQASISKQFRRSILSAGAGRTVIPGNGVYLTSRQESVSGGYSYAGFRRLSLSTSAQWIRMTAMMQELPIFSQFNITGNISYQLGAGFNLTGSYAYRHQGVSVGTFLTDSSRISFGIMYSPGNIPLSFH